MIYLMSLNALVPAGHLLHQRHGGVRAVHARQGRAVQTTEVLHSGLTSVWDLSNVKTLSIFFDAT